MLMTLRQEYRNSVPGIALGCEVTGTIPSRVLAQDIKEVWKPWFPEDCSMRHIIEVFDSDPCERYRINPMDS